MSTEKIFRKGLRTVIPPLAIEADRLKNIPMVNQICKVGELDEVESESHFLVYVRWFVRGVISWNL